MVWLVIILAIALLGETGTFFWGLREKIHPTKVDMLEEYWFDFLDWCSDRHNYAGMGLQYESFNVPGKEGTPIRTPIPNEANFWFWVLDFKYGDIKSEYNDRTPSR